MAGVQISPNPLIGGIADSIGVVQIKPPRSMRNAMV